jgi:hypothetical protein
MFDLPTMPAGGMTDSMHSAVIQRIQQMYEVGVMLKPQYRNPSTMSFAPYTVVVRGSVQNSKAVKEATVALHEHFTGRAGVSISIVTTVRKAINSSYSV